MKNIGDLDRRFWERLILVEVVVIALLLVVGLIWG